jgi:hypothetical protein
MVLLASRQNSMLTRPRLVQWVGTASYSFYLWHWPIVCILAGAGMLSSPVAVASGMLATLACGWLSYRFIEVPTRAWLPRLRAGGEMAAIGLVVIAIVIPSQIIRQLDGVPTRFSAEVQAIFNERNNRNLRIDECLRWKEREHPACTYGGRELGVIVLGDSHASSVIQSVAKALPDADLHALDWTRAACKTIAGLTLRSRQKDVCAEHLDYVREQSKMLPPVPMIILFRADNIVDPSSVTAASGPPYLYAKTLFSSPTDAYFAEIREAMIDTVCGFASHRPVYWVRPTPDMPFDVPRRMAMARNWGETERLGIPWEDYRKRTAFVWSAQDEAAARCGVRILDPTPTLCTDGQCWAEFEGRPVFYDDDHLSERGAAMLIPLFRSVFAPQETPGSVPVSSESGGG